MFVLHPSQAMLGAYRQFIVFKLVPSASRPGKTDKWPIRPTPPHDVVSAHDPAMWLTWEEAAVIAESLGPEYGVGFVITATDPFWFMDIDKCAADGVWMPHALALLGRFPGCAVEVSSSGEGLHLLGLGSVPPNHKTRYGQWFEFYSSGRFCALTGRDALGDVATDHTDAITQLVAEYLTRDPNEITGEWSTGPVPDWRGNTDDDELIARMVDSVGGASAALGFKATFRELWDGDAEALAKYWPESGGVGYNQSSADGSLAQALAFWTGKDCERMERLMRRSALVREKWDSPRPQGTYLTLTIKNAVGRQTAVLQDKPVELVSSALPATTDAPAPRLVEGSTFVSLADQQTMFKGCVYIQSQNRVLIPGGDIIKPETFRVVYGGYSFLMDDRNEKISSDAWEAFTQNKALRRPIAHDLVFRPELPPAAIIEDSGRVLANSWWPINTPCLEGDATPFTNHIAKLFPDERDREILTSYLAAIVQYPGYKFQWAPLIQGIEGNGKTLIITAISRAVGERYTHLPNIDDLANSGGKFTAWLKGKIFIGFEEVRTDDKRNMVETLKAIITNSRVEIQAKGVDQVTGDNRANIIACSNHKDAIPKTTKDRRWGIFYTAQQNDGDLERDGMDGNYMPDLWDWCQGRGRYHNTNGFAVINNFLRTYAIKTEYNPASGLHRAPKTSSTAEAIELSAGTIEQEIMEAVEQGLPGFAGGWISSIMFDRLLERIGLHRRIPPRKRREILMGIGYDWHPAFDQGRATITVKPEGSRPRLFIKKGHIKANLTDPRAIAKRYEQDQTDAAVQNAATGT